MNQPGAPRQVEILLVEDYLPDVLLMTKFLNVSSVKTRVNVARDGQTALDYLKQENGFEKAARPDLIFLDLSLPLRDGREVLNEIKSNQTLMFIPIIIVTASISGTDILNAHNAKVDFYMVKPTDTRRFTAAMNYVEEVWLKTLAGLRNN